MNNVAPQATFSVFLRLFCASWLVPLRHRYKHFILLSTCLNQFCVREFLRPLVKVILLNNVLFFFKSLNYFTIIHFHILPLFSHVYFFFFKKLSLLYHIVTLRLSWQGSNHRWGVQIMVLHGLKHKLTMENVNSSYIHCVFFINPIVTFRWMRFYCVK